MASCSDVYSNSPVESARFAATAVATHALVHYRPPVLPPSPLFKNGAQAHRSLYSVACMHYVRTQVDLGGSRRNLRSFDRARLKAVLAAVVTKRETQTNAYMNYLMLILSLLKSGRRVLCS